MSADQYQERAETFTEMLGENRLKAYKRFGFTLFHSMDEEAYFAEMERMGWSLETALDFYNLGVVASGRGHHSKAQELYEKAIKLDGDLAAAHHNLAVACEALDQPAKQKAALEKYIALMDRKDPKAIPEEDRELLKEAREALAELG